MNADSRRVAARAEDAARVERLRAGDETAFGELYDAWFDRVRDFVFRIVGNAAADVAQEAFLAAWRSVDALEDPNAFGEWLLRIARNRALNRLEREQHIRPVDAMGIAWVESVGPSAGASEGFRAEDQIVHAEDPARAVEDAEIVELIWESADTLGERDSTVLDLTLRHGLTPAEIGEVVGVGLHAANQLVPRVLGRLGDAVRARVLWRGGSPVCEELAVVLESAGVVEFDADAVRVTRAHADACAVCEERRRLHFSPAALFGAIPFLVTPALLKSEIAAALAGDGVPMQGSAVGRPAQSPDVGEGGSPPGLVAPDLANGGVASWKSWQRVAAVAAAVVVLLVVSAAWLLAGGNGSDEPVVTGNAVSSTTTTDPAVTTTSTSAPSTSTSTTSTTDPPSDAPPSAADPPGAAAPTGAPPAGAPPAVPPPTSDPAPSATIEVAITPSSIASGDEWPTLTWSVSGDATVRVKGPADSGFERDTRSGSEHVCPDPSSSEASACDAEPGTYTYTVRVPAMGASIEEKSVILTVSDAGPGPP